MNVRNKVVIIIDATSDIGKSIATEFSTKHTKLVLVDKNENELSAIVNICRINIKNEVLDIVSDIRDDEAITNIIEKCVKQFNKIDIIINCAAMVDCRDVFLESLTNIYDKIIKFNIEPVQTLIKIAKPHLAKTRGSIINISSISPNSIISDTIAYNIYKAILTKYTRTVAMELAAEEVKINAVHCGPTTPNYISVSMDQEDRGGLKQKQGLGCVELEEISELILNLASDDSTCLIGAKNIIDVGFSFIN